MFKSKKLIFICIFIFIIIFSIYNFDMVQNAFKCIFDKDPIKTLIDSVKP